MRWLRVLAGLALAPVVATAVVRLTLPLLLEVRSPNIWIAAFVSGVIVTLLVGFPAHVVRHRRGRSGLAGYVGLGAFLGTIPFLIYAAFMIAPVLTAMLVHRSLDETPQVLENLVKLASVGAAAGASGAAAFWFAAVCRPRVG